MTVTTSLDGPPTCENGRFKGEGVAGEGREVVVVAETAVLVPVGVDEAEHQALRAPITLLAPATSTTRIAGGQVQV